VLKLKYFHDDVAAVAEAENDDTAEIAVAFACRSRAAPGALLEEAGDGPRGELIVTALGICSSSTCVMPSARQPSTGVGRRAVKTDFSMTTTGTEFGAVSAAFRSAFWGRQGISRMPHRAGVTDLDVVFARVRRELSDVEKPGEKGAARRKLPHCGDNVSNDGAIRSSDDTLPSKAAYACLAHPLAKVTLEADHRGENLNRDPEIAQRLQRGSGWKTNRKTGSATDCRPARKIPSSHLDQPTSTSCILSPSI